MIRYSVLAVEMSRHSRRQVLRGVAGGATVGIGLGLSTSTVAAREGQGGSGIIAAHTWERHEANDGARFQIVKKISEQTFACNGGPRTWACYRIRFENQPSDEIHNVFVNPNRRVDTTEGGPYPKGRGYEAQDGYTGWHEFTRDAQTCHHYVGGMTVGGIDRTQAVSVSFKPIDNARQHHNRQ